MECDDVENPGVNISNEERDSAAVNSLILDYYKRFGRKRDLEQYFSLSTAQSEIRDPASSFWHKMKSQNSSSDSGGKKSESSNEVCRISIKCTVPEASSSQDEKPKSKSDSDSPPIITDDVDPGPSRHSDDEGSVKSDDYHSQKSVDVTLDTSINKVVSPSSSITSQRKLEWDSLADVGYANESDRKASSSSLSTLERLALKQQYSNNDTNDNMGTPTAHSTMLDVNESKTKNQKGIVKRTMRIHNKDKDLVEVSLPKSEINPQSINVNLTKHISFNVEKDGGVSVGSVKNDVSVSPEKSSEKTEKCDDKLDKEIQTSIIRPGESSTIDKPAETYGLRVPVLINLNSLRKRSRKQKLRTKRRKLRVKKKSSANKENVPAQEKSGEQVSEAESFEYMPGHMYHQNQMKHSQNRSTTAGNKSSLESSGAATTTDSSKNSKYSFTRDLEKSIELLKTALNKNYKDSNLKKELIKGVVQRILETKYRDDESSTEFLSGLSYSSKKLGLGDGTHTTTSTSDATTEEKETVEPPKPKKSILRLDKFNSNPIASTSQSAPNLPSVSNSEKPVFSKLDKPMSSFTTESDGSSKEKHSSDTALAKTSSEELYQKYILALKKEQAYKKHLKEKEKFLKQKLASSESTFKVPIQIETKSRNRLKDLIKDLTRNNYDDGSGDASKLEGGSCTDAHRYNFAEPGSHSVFTLSSCNCHNQNRKVSENITKSEKHSVHQADKPNIVYGCACHQPNIKIDVADSSVQCNIKHQTDKEQSHISIAHVVSDDETGDVKYVCVGAKKGASVDVPENILIYKCSRLANAEVQMEDSEHKSSHTLCSCCEKKQSQSSKHVIQPSTSKEGDNIQRATSKSSQTDVLKAFKMSHIPSDKSIVQQNKIDNECSNKKIVYDSIGLATRVIQTEISMNPRIPEATISDINIIDDEDLVKFVSASYKEIPKKRSEDTVISSQPVAPQSSMHSLPSVQNVPTLYQEHQIGSDANLDDKKSDKEIQSDVDELSPQIEIEGKDSQERFSIPIKGTNMTLLVSLGSKGSTAPLEKNKSISTYHAPKPSTIPIFGRKLTSQSTVTESKKSFENPPSSIAGSSKGVQSQSSDLFDDFDRQKINKRRMETKHREGPEQMRQPSYEDEKDNKFKKITHPEYKYYDDDNDKQKEQNKNFKINHDGNFVSQSHIEQKKDQPKDFYDNENKQRKQECQRPEKSVMQMTPREADHESSLNEHNNNHYKEEKRVSQKNYSDLVEESQSEVHYDEDNKETNYFGPQLQYQQGEIKDTDIYDQPMHYKEVDYKHLPQNPKSTNENNKQIDHEMNRNIRSNDYYDQPYVEQSRPRSNFELQPRYEERLIENNDLKDEFQNLTSGSGLRGHTYPRKGQINEKRPLLRSSTDVSLQTDPPHDSEHVVTQKKSTDSDKTSKDNANFARQTEVSDEVTQRRPFSYNNETLKTFLRTGTDSESPNECNNPDSNRISSKQIQTSQEKASDARPNKPNTYSAIYSEQSNYRNTKEIKPNDNQKPRSRSPKRIESPESSRPTRFHDNGVTKSKWGTQYDKKIYSNSEETSKAGPSEKCKEKINIPENRKNCGSTQKRPKSPYSCKHQENCSSMSKCAKHKTCKCKCSCKESSNSDSSNDCYNDMQARCPNTFLTNAFHGVNCNCMPNHSRNQQFEGSNICWGIPPQIVPCTNSCCNGNHAGTDPIMNLIQSITNRYKKKDVDKGNRKRCFKEIMGVLSYLLDTEDSSCQEECTCIQSSSSDDNVECHPSAPDCPPQDSECGPRNVECGPSNSNKIDKGVQFYKPKCMCNTDNSANLAGGSSEAPTIQLLNNIKRECEKYQRKRCKCHANRCNASSTTNLKCSCKQVHQSQCRRHQCKCCKSKTNIEKTKKKNLAYNLIVKPSETMNSTTETNNNKERRPLQNVVVKVPPKRKQYDKVPFKEMSTKIERNNPNRSPRVPKSGRSRSWPNESEISSGDASMKCPAYTVRQYLEKNRPDFVQNCSERQDCLKVACEKRSTERGAQRELLSAQLARQSELRSLSESQLRQLARELGVNTKSKRQPPNFMSEREMKKHSQKIYKSLPEVTQKKEELKKESIKKTNLLMANLFKKNLQKKILRGSVNLSNYSTVIKI